MAVEPLVGSAPQGWTYKTLGEACEEAGGDVQTGPFGSQLHAADYVPTGIPSIMPSNIGDNRIVEDGIARITLEDAERLERYRVRPGDIVYSRRGDVERRALVRDREDGWLCGTGCLRVRLGQGGPDPRYAAYYLGDHRVREWIVRHAHGATMPNLNTAILSACPLLVPPLPEQRAIAHVLGALDDKIELNRRMNETLEAMARALFKSWFVDFDPVRAKMDGRWQRGESLPGLPAELYDLFPDRLVESEIGKVPDGWEVVALTDQVEVLGGGTPKTSVAEYWGGEIPWFAMADLPAVGQVWVLDTERTITTSGLDNSSTRVLPEGTTILTARGTVGEVALAGLPMAMNQSCYGLRPKIGAGYYGYFLVRSLVEKMRRRAHGSVFDTITRRTLAGIRVLQPPLFVPEALEDAVKPWIHRIRANLREADALSELRDTLLPKLISGELRVPHAERFVERTPHA